MSKFFKRCMVLLYLLAVLIASNEVSAQGVIFQNGSRGIFQRGVDNKTVHEQTGLLFGNRDEQALTGNISNQTFETPIGNGVIFLFAASLSYVVLKKKEKRP